jgi:ACS family tartrate transporter-like MFS transporter
VGHIALAGILGAGGFILAAATHNDIVQLFALTVAAMGIYGALTTFWTLPQSFLGGSAAAAGIALVNAIANLGGFVGPSLMGWLKQHSGGYGAGFLALAAGLCMTALIIAAMSGILKSAAHQSRQNR